MAKTTQPTGRSGGRSADRPAGRSSDGPVSQPLSDDGIVVRQLSHYQFSWVAGTAGGPGVWTLQLVLDQGAWEEVLTIDADDADNLQDMLSTAGTVYYDVRRRALMFGTTPVGHA